MKNKFDIGTKVYVRSAPSVGHIRTPKYIMGKYGIVERVCGCFRNPEELAYGRNGLPKLTLYRVRFELRTVWEHYQGMLGDSIDVELYEHWLIPA
tara:strand:+ start:443 stop:727 length:285 start_codon:yes stop_codon:yes gene_type:complete